MPFFLDTDSGSINLDHVTRVTSKPFGQRASTEVCLWSADGKVLGTFIAASPFDAVEFTAPIVPAAAGDTAVLVALLPERHGGRPAAQDVVVEHVPIVAWRLCYGGAIPVLIEPPAKNQITLISMAGGRLLEADHRTYDGIDEATRCILAREQADWDHRHRDEAPAPDAGAQR